MKPINKILAKSYAVLITPFVLRMLYGMWIFEKKYVAWGLLAVAILSFFLGLALALISLNKDIGTWED